MLVRNWTQILQYKRWWTFFFPDEFLALLMEQTNLYAAQKIEKRKEIIKSNRLSKWQDISAAEMKVFVGLLLQMGPCAFPSFEHYWSYIM